MSPADHPPERSGLPEPAPASTPGPAPETRRWRLDVRYDGTAFSGWAGQRGRRTVQGELELWLGRVLALRQSPRLVCAGRTDAGVHARGQVVHVDLPGAALSDPGALRRRLARALPPDLAVTAIRRAPAAFDARFAAIWRRYCYRIADLDTVPDPLRRGFVTTLPRRIDVDLLNETAPALLGLRDFGAFCRRREGATTVRTLLQLGAARDAENVVEVSVRADAFCHSMVRCLVGALVEVAAGRRSTDWLGAVTAAAVRRSEIPVLPAHGLTLEEVGYPPDDLLAARVAESQAVRTLAATPGPEHRA